MYLAVRILCIALIFIVSCKSQPGAKGDYDKYDPDKTYKLQLNPSDGSGYHYDITNKTKINLEVDGKEIENRTEADVAINYAISKDSSGNFLFRMVYL